MKGHGGGVGNIGLLEVSDIDSNINFIGMINF